MNSSKKFMRIPKTKSEYYKLRMEKLFEASPDSKFVRNRHRVLRYTLLEKYPWIENIPKEEMITFLKETVYIDRLIRLKTEGVEPVTKKILSDQFIQQELYVE